MRCSKCILGIARDFVSQQCQSVIYTTSLTASPSCSCTNAHYDCMYIISITFISLFSRRLIVIVHHVSITECICGDDNVYDMWWHVMIMIRFGCWRHKLWETDIAPASAPSRKWHARTLDNIIVCPLTFIIAFHLLIDIHDQIQFFTVCINTGCRGALKLTLQNAGLENDGPLIYFSNTQEVGDWDVALVG